MPCAGGGAEYLFSSPALRGPKAAWKLLGTLFESNYTVLTPFYPQNVVDVEFVTAGYFGNLAGDPRGGITRCLTNNGWDMGANTQYYCGTQAGGPGSKLEVNFTDPFAVGLFDWGCTGPNGKEGAKGLAALEVHGDHNMWTMARTLSPSSPNQVTDAGRKIITAWLGGGGRDAQALPRDLSLDPVTGALLQQFVPELSNNLRTGDGSPLGVSSVQVEVVADFTVAPGITPAPFGVTLYETPDGTFSQQVAVDLALELFTAGPVGGPLFIDPTEPQRYHVHIFTDNGMTSVICNNRTAVTHSAHPLPPFATLLSLFGVDGVSVSVEWKAWALRNASIVNM